MAISLSQSVVDDGGDLFNNGTDHLPRVSQFKATNVPVDDVVLKQGNMSGGRRVFDGVMNMGRHH